MNGLGTVKGKVLDIDTKEPLAFANIILSKHGNKINVVSSDFDGNYVFSNINPGNYDIKTSYLGYNELVINNVPIHPYQANKIFCKISKG